MPGEVEAAISELPMVDNVKVIGIPSDFYGEEVGACIILKEGYTFDEKAIKEALENKIARYKVPSQYIVYDSFPTLGTGKIDAVTLRKDAIARILR
jgi:fatty-acyl-CoA synthase